MVQFVSLGATPNEGRNVWNGNDQELKSLIDNLSLASTILSKIKEVDGSGSGLDADLLDGINSAGFIRTNGSSAGVTPFTLNADPTNGDQVVRRSWIENYVAQKDQKENVRAASTGNIALSTGGLLTVDGVALAAGQRVLVKNQTTASQNGIYVVAAGAWSRSDDGQAGELSNGAFVFVAEGGQAGTGWWITTPDPITVGTTALTWQQFVGPGVITTGRGLERNGNMIQVALEAITGAMILNGTITADEIAAANKDGTAATPSLRTLGNGALQACAGNDARLSDTRTPTDATVTNAKLSADMKDGDPGVATARSLGTGANQAAAGNHGHNQLHDRGHGLGSTVDHTDIKNAPQAGFTLIYRPDGDEAAFAGEGYYFENPATASAPPRIFPVGSHGFRGALEGMVGAGRVIVLVTGTVTVVRIQVNTAPTADLTLRVRHNGVQMALPVITAGTNEVVINPNQPVVPGDFFTMDITTLTTISGADLSAFYLMQAA